MPTYYWDGVQLVYFPFWVDLLHVSWCAGRIVVWDTVWSELVVVTVVAIVIAIPWCVGGVLAEDIVVGVVSCWCVVRPAEDVVTCAAVHFLFFLWMGFELPPKVYKFYYKF